MDHTSQISTVIWRNHEFVGAAAVQQADNDIRRALETASAKKNTKSAEFSRSLASQRLKCQAQLEAAGAPTLPALVVMKTDVDRRYSVSVDIGLALVTMGASRLDHVLAETSHSLTELRTPEVVHLLQACARMGWDREIDRAISAMRPGPDNGHLGDALLERIAREPWRIADHGGNWMEQVKRAQAFAARIETQLLRYPRIDIQPGAASPPHASHVSMTGAAAEEASYPRMR